MYPIIPWSLSALPDTHHFKGRWSRYSHERAQLWCSVWEDGKNVTISSQLMLSTASAKMQRVFITSDRFLYFCFLLADIKLESFCQRQKSLKGGWKNRKIISIENYFHIFYQASELCDRSWLCTNYSASFKFCKTIAINATFSCPSGWSYVRT